VPRTRVRQWGGSWFESVAAVTAERNAPIVAARAAASKGTPTTTGLEDGTRGTGTARRQRGERQRRPGRSPNRPPTISQGHVSDKLVRVSGVAAVKVWSFARHQNGGHVEVL
jgi:hypothetical protein